MGDNFFFLLSSDPPFSKHHVAIMAADYEHIKKYAKNII
jgi:hypothetical protein